MPAYFSFAAALARVQLLWSDSMQITAHNRQYYFLSEGLSSASNTVLMISSIIADSSCSSSTPCRSVSIICPETPATKMQARQDSLTQKCGGAKPRYPDGLTSREVEVLCHMARGKTKQENGSDLHISENSVSNHLEHVFVKTGTLLI